MPEVHMGKRFGLMKLKKIAGSRKDPRWFVSPYFVLGIENQLRRNQLKRASRLLVRADEKGRRYDKLYYPHAPRVDVHTTTQVEGHQKALPVDVIEKNVFWNLQRWGQEKHAKLVIHPTRLRKSIAWTGRAVIHPESSELKVFLNKKPSSSETIHRHLDADADFVFDLATGKLVESFRGDWLKGSRDANTIAKRISKFVMLGIKSGQINPRRLSTEVSFLTWRNAPTTLELFDLHERRNVSEKE